jgi:hypothetical protein
MRQVVFESVTFTDCGESNVTEKALDKFEKEKRTKLPEDYRQFLIQVNGGKPKPCGCKCLSSPEPKPGNNFNSKKELKELLRYYPENLRDDAKEFWKRAYIPIRVVELFPFSRPVRPKVSTHFFGHFIFFVTIFLGLFFVGVLFF